MAKKYSTDTYIINPEHEKGGIGGSVQNNNISVHQTRKLTNYSKKKKKKKYRNKKKYSYKDTLISLQKSENI